MKEVQVLQLLSRVNLCMQSAELRKVWIKEKRTWAEDNSDILYWGHSNQKKKKRKNKNTKSELMD